VSLLVVSPEIEDRVEIKVGNWAKHKKTFHSERYTYFMFKKKTHIIFFCCSYTKMTIFKFILWTFQLLGFGRVSSPVTKKTTSTVSILLWRYTKAHNIANDIFE
jgi:hypothetical protein